VVDCQVRPAVLIEPVVCTPAVCHHHWLLRHVPLDNVDECLRVSFVIRTSRQKNISSLATDASNNPLALYCISFFRTCSRQFQQYNLGRQLTSVTHAQRFPGISHGSTTASLLLFQNSISPRPTAPDTVYVNIRKCYHKINLWLPKFDECSVCSLQTLSRRELKITTCYISCWCNGTLPAWRDDSVDFHAAISKHDDNIYNFFHFSKCRLCNKNSMYSPNY